MKNLLFIRVLEMESAITNRNSGIGGRLKVIKKDLVEELEMLGERELQELAEYVAFLKFRSRFILLREVNEDQIAALYREFSEEDRKLAEEGMADYANSLAKEDKH